MGGVGKGTAQYTDNSPREFFLYDLFTVNLQLLLFTLEVGDELTVEK